MLLASNFVALVRSFIWFVSVFLVVWLFFGVLLLVLGFGSLLIVLFLLFE